MYYDNSTLINLFIRGISFTNPCVTYDCYTIDNVNFISSKEEVILNYSEK